MKRKLIFIVVFFITIFTTSADISIYRYDYPENSYTDKNYSHFISIQFTEKGLIRRYEEKRFNGTQVELFTVNDSDGFITQNMDYGDRTSLMYDINNASITWSDRKLSKNKLVKNNNNYNYLYDGKVVASYLINNIDKNYQVKTGNNIGKYFISNNKLKKIFFTRAQAQLIDIKHLDDESTLITIKDSDGLFIEVYKVKGNVPKTTDLNHILNSLFLGWDKGTFLYSFLGNSFEDEMVYKDVKNNSITLQTDNVTTEDPFSYIVNQNTNEKQFSLMCDDFLLMYNHEDLAPFFMGINNNIISEKYLFSLSNNFEASSFLKESKKVYTPQLLGNTDLDSPWVEGVSGDGIGEKIFFAEEKLVQNLYFSNGYVSVTKPYLYYCNNRVKKIKITDELDKTFEMIVSIEDTPNPQKINLNSQQKRKLVLEILDVYPGSKWDDTCINFILISQ